jgi:membrane protein YdbS with pleckstrin-like domain
MKKGLLSWFIALGLLIAGVVFFALCYAWGTGWWVSVGIALLVGAIIFIGIGLYQFVRFDRENYKPEENPPKAH